MIHHCEDKNMLRRLNEEKMRRVQDLNLGWSISRPTLNQDSPFHKILNLAFRDFNDYFST